MDYNLMGSDLALDVSFWMIGFNNPKYPLAEKGSLMMEMTEKIRTLGVLALLSQLDVDIFCKNLSRSAGVRKKYLEELHSQGITDEHHQCSSRINPLLDAIAAGDFAMAEDIVKLSLSEKLEKSEYEDDYCYAQLLHHLIQNKSQDDHSENLLNRFETYLEKSTPRLLICKSLINRDINLFKESFVDFLEDYDIGVIKSKEEYQLETPMVVARRFISVEGLALIKLAELSGFNIEDEYLFCPTIARRIPLNIEYPRETTV